MAWSASAPAKINLTLRIVERRPDGYHGLDTIFQSIALADALTLEPVDGPFSLTCDDPAVPTDATNLAWRAADAVAQAIDQPLEGWRLHLVKHVPAQSGLGGGSSDAVAAARLVLAAGDDFMDDHRLRQVLAPIGADVPFFVGGGTSRGLGCGDEIAPVAAPPAMHVVVVRPPFGVSTREAYGWFDRDMPAGAVTHVRPRVPESAEEWDAHWRDCLNDLQAPVMARHPAIADIIAGLTARGAAMAMLSGSGSACFGIFEDRETAAAAADGWPSGWGVWRTHTLGAREYGEATTPRPSA